MFRIRAQRPDAGKFTALRTYRLAAHDAESDGRRTGMKFAFDRFIPEQAARFAKRNGVILFRAALRTFILRHGNSHAVVRYSEDTSGTPS